jgi:hypothetical protein
VLWEKWNVVFGNGNGCVVQTQNAGASVTEHVMAIRGQKQKQKQWVALIFIDRQVQRSTDLLAAHAAVGVHAWPRVNLTVLLPPPSPPLGDTPRGTTEVAHRWVNPRAVWSS